MCAESRRGPDGSAVAQREHMKKSPIKKLALRTQTVRVLTNEALGLVPGGLEPVVPGFIMKDTIIIRTSSR